MEVENKVEMGRDWLVIHDQHELRPQLLKVNCFSLLSNPFDYSVCLCVAIDKVEGWGLLSRLAGC